MYKPANYNKSTYKKLQSTPQYKVDNLIFYLKQVVNKLERDGAKILPHLTDTDENDGQFLRQAMVDCHLWHFDD